METLFTVITIVVVVALGGAAVTLIGLARSCKALVDKERGRD